MLKKKIGVFLSLDILQGRARDKGLHASALVEKSFQGRGMQIQEKETGNGGKPVQKCVTESSTIASK